MGYAYYVADHAETVMAEPYAGLPEIGEYQDLYEAQDDFMNAWSGMIHVLHQCLSPAWRVVEDGPVRRGHPGGQVIAQSAQHELIVEEGPGGYGYAYISLTLRPGLEDGSAWSNRMLPLARAQLPVVAQAFFDRVAQHMELWVPNGYTSTPYQSGAADPIRLAA